MAVENMQANLSSQRYQVKDFFHAATQRLRQFRNAENVTTTRIGHITIIGSHSDLHENTQEQISPHVMRTQLRKLDDGKTIYFRNPTIRGNSQPPPEDSPLW